MPTLRVAIAGVTTMAVSVCVPTVKLAVPETPAAVAWMVTVPEARAVACPRVPPTLEMATMLSSVEVQVLMPVTSRKLPSLRMAVAVKKVFTPAGVETMAGATWICLMVALETVSVVEPITPMKVAVMVVVPAAMAVACPREPPAFETCATMVLLELQVAMPVTFWEVKSL